MAWSIRYTLRGRGGKEISLQQTSLEDREEAIRAARELWNRIKEGPELYPINPFLVWEEPMEE